MTGFLQYISALGLYQVEGKTPLSIPDLLRFKLGGVSLILAIAGLNDECIAFDDSLQLKLFIEKISINIYPFCISV